MKEIVENIIPSALKTYQKKVMGLTFPSRSVWWYRNRPGLCSLWRHSSFQKTYKTEKKLDECYKVSFKTAKQTVVQRSAMRKKDNLYLRNTWMWLYNIGYTIEENTVNWLPGPLHICMTSHICYTDSNICTHADTSHSLSRFCSWEVR